jgi:hypothetical protein
MGTTTNNGWPTPVATDLVKDGWEAIKDLGDAIDTTLGVYAPSTPGLTLINTTSFSGVSSQSVNDVFSATYQNYKVIGNFTATSSDANNLRLRVAGADNSANNYIRQILSADSASVTGSTQTSTQFTQFWSGSSTNPSLLEAIFYSPFESVRTTVLSRMSQDGTAMKHLGGVHTVASSFTGFTLIASSGNFSGTIRVYGLAN